MPVLKIEVDSETYDRLVEQAVAERRPVIWQAEISIRRALGLPFPYGPELAIRSRGEEAGDAPDD